MLRPADFKGSRYRCLLGTHGDRTEVAEFLTALATPWASVSPANSWMPSGFLQPDEAQLDKASILSPDLRQQLQSWWLASYQRTPCWGLVSTCTMSDGSAGLLLVEAKAYEEEFKVQGDDCGATDGGNAQRIQTALQEANTSLNDLIPGWSLSHIDCYQLSNRVAWAWKVASLGMPVVMLYLGFLDAKEMSTSNQAVLRHSRHWLDHVRSSSAASVPPDVWDTTLLIGGVPLIITAKAAQTRVIREVVLPIDT